jgi:phosphatidylethanolamine/phosphatidyl-N-methylethanolamine N-methyltransferase
MNRADTLRAYRSMAGWYDLVFGASFSEGRRVAVRLANDAPDQTILEVGVGTGLSLPLFRKDARVTGIDVSPHMLAKARLRVARRGLTQVEALRRMAAERLDFPDDHFDAVVVLYVVSVLSDPARFGTALRRVVKPGGRIVIVNHFSSVGGPMREVERFLAPYADRIGFHADFPLDPFLAASGLRLRHSRQVNLFGYWTLLDCVNDKPPSEPPP